MTEAAVAPPVHRYPGRLRKLLNGVAWYPGTVVVGPLVGAVLWGWPWALGGALITQNLVGVGIGLLIGLGWSLLIVIDSFLVFLVKDRLLEGRRLTIQGCRQLSPRESARLLPLTEEAGSRLGLRRLPRLRVADDLTRRAETHLRHIVVSRPLLQEFGDAELAGILTHELYHWASGHVVAARVARAWAYPVIGICEAFDLLRRFASQEVQAMAAATTAGGASLVLRFVVAPLMAKRSRQQEYDADAAAARAGYGPALAKALQYLGDFEGGRTGWDAVMCATHPPTVFRVEALEDFPLGPANRRP